MTESIRGVAMVQGASRGIGLALVEALLERPDVERVIATSRRPEESPGLSLLKAAYSERLTTLPLDVLDESTIVLAAEQLKQDGRKHIHWLFNCAGVLHDDAGLAPEKRIEDLQPEAMEHAFRVNAAGPMLVAKHFLPFMRHPERAILANLSARVGSIEDNRLGGWYGYRASKAAQNMLTRTLALEMKRRARNVICLALHPGTVDTDLSRPFQRNVPPEKLFDPSRAAAQLLRVVDAATTDQNGSFLAWDGQPIPW